MITGILKVVPSFSGYTRALVPSFEGNDTISHLRAGFFDIRPPNLYLSQLPERFQFGD